MLAEGKRGESETSKTLTRLEMTKNGAAQKIKDKKLTPQGIAMLEGIDAFGLWTLAWTKGLANESETELWLKADIVLLKETMRTRRPK